MRYTRKMKVEEVDVEKIMREIKKKKSGVFKEESIEKIEGEMNLGGAECDIPTMEVIMQSLEMQTEMQCVEYINNNYRLQFYRDIENKSKLVIFVKRLIRKLIRFCVHPIINDQSELNFKMMKVLMIQNNKINELREEINEMKKLNRNDSIN